MGEQSKLRGKAEILTEIYVSAEVETMIRSLKPAHLQEDIKQHCFMELLEKDEAFIMDLHNRGKLKNYIVKVLHNTARFDRTSFAKQLGREILLEDLYNTRKSIDYADTLNEFEADIEHQEVVIQHEAEQSVEYDEVFANLDKLGWYKKELMLLYVGVKECRACQNLINTDDHECLFCRTENDYKFKAGTYQAISNLTGIPVSSIYYTIQDTIDISKLNYFQLTDKKAAMKAMIAEYKRHERNEPIQTSIRNINENVA